MLETVETSTGPRPVFSVIWLHGLGADGHDFAPIVPELVRRDWPALRFVFPHAPVMPITINNGHAMRAWYDIVSLDFSKVREDAAGVRRSIAEVEALIGRERDRGIPAHRVILAGFSQGGAITLAAGLRREQPLLGLAVLSAYLPLAAETPVEATPQGLTTPLFMAHGTQDPVVPLAAGQRAADTLRALGMDASLRRYPMPHSVCADEVRDLGDWMTQRFAA
ncbi:dienelactone hydrolase family protein [Silanimonas sp.]|uniref:alpha/beta hydrolase n=1 Tax=Silanimonas sp. TaxID=1929290 RepID=UPI001BC4EEF9|nr:dienelactone hydrolase family protein [Silanimonas sp.]MBS3896497.1 dienelactone hydrolase family protein [Silanimonas sp.]MBS3924419.1 dienelactone hydrolase family protein [Xanthomonadaceae bacterium]